MLDIKQIRENTQEIIDLLNRRGGDFSYLNEVVKTDERRREIIQEVEKVKALRNENSKLIGQYKKEGKSTDELMKEIEGIKELTSDEKVKSLYNAYNSLLMEIPNLPDDSCPVGKDEDV